MSKALPSDKLVRWVSAYHELVSPQVQAAAGAGGRPVLVPVPPLDES